MRSSGTVVRTYAAADRAAAERTYQIERQQAASRGWEPVSRRWRSEGREHVLTVVFETSGERSAVTASPARSAAPAATALAERSRPVPWDPVRAAERDASRVVVETLDLHCAGEPLRLIRSGYPAVPLLPIDERGLGCAKTPTTSGARYEPRGHRDMYGAVLLPHRDDADAAVSSCTTRLARCAARHHRLTQGLTGMAHWRSNRPPSSAGRLGGLVTATAGLRSAPAAPRRRRLFRQRAGPARRPAHHATSRGAALRRCG
jgi:hypothetical protein